jgi:hypothetical protein
MAEISLKQMRSILRDIGDDLVDGIRGELERQGHNNTGTLSDSIRYEIEEFGGNMSLLVIADDVEYAQYVNEGFFPNSLPNMDAIQEWVNERGITPSSQKMKNSKDPQRALAFAIAKAMMSEGSPTSGAFKYSSNRKRRGFVNRPFGSRKRGIERKIVDGMSVEIDISMDSIIKKA